MSIRAHRHNKIGVKMTDFTSLLERLRGEHGTDPWQVNPAAKIAADAIEAQANRIEELQDAFREIYEVYAGSEGFIPETCPEAYQQQLIKEMAEIAAKYMRIRYGE